MRALHDTPLLWLLVGIQVCSTQNSTYTYKSGGQTWNIEAVMPDHPAPPETYLCMRVNLPDADALKLTGIEPLSQEALVHHMLLYGELLCQRNHKQAHFVMARKASKKSWSLQNELCPRGARARARKGVMIFVVL